MTFKRYRYKTCAISKTVFVVEYLVLYLYYGTLREDQDSVHLYWFLLR